jgi:aryl-alcohol dehydrogenase-like predicted oxidoreductase
MNYRYLGRTGLKVSELCLGAMTFGREADEATSFDIMNAFTEAGGNFIDTANVYGRGVSEEIVGRWLATRKRDALVIATKVRFGMGDDVNEIGLSRKHIMSAVEASLRRLGTDYIDLYQVHCWDPGTPLDETLAALDQLVKQGKVRYIGVSNYKAHQIQKAVDLSRQHGWEAFIALQPLYNLLDRALEWEIIELCQNEGLGIIPWSPLRGGWLSGKYSRGMELPPDDTRIGAATKHGWSEGWDAYNNERTWSVIDTLFEVAAETGKTVPQIALNWVKDAPAITAPIIGARTLVQLNDNLGSTGWALTGEQRERLNAVSAITPPYPYDFIARATGVRER